MPGTNDAESNARITLLITEAINSYDARDIHTAGAKALEVFPLLVAQPADRYRAGACFAISKVLAEANHPDEAFKVLNVALDFFLTGKKRELQEFPKFLNRFGELLRKEQRFTEAEPLFLEALSRSKAQTPLDQFTISIISNNLGLCYMATGNYGAAERALEDSIAAIDQVHDSDEQLAVTLDNLGGLYKNRNNTSKARPLIERAVALLSRLKPPDDQDLLIARINLADLDSKVGEFTRAEQSLRDVLTHASGGSRESVRTIGSASIVLAIVLRRTHRYAEAEEALLETCKRLMDAGLSMTGMYWNAMHQLALVRTAAGNYRDALDLLSKCVQSDDEQIVRFSGGAADVRQLMYKEKLAEGFEQLISLVTKHLADDASSVELAFLHVVNRKGLITEKLMLRGRLTRYSSERLSDNEETLRAVRAHLDKVLLEGPGVTDLLVYRRHVARLITQEQELEALITRAHDEVQALRRVGSIDELRKVIPSGAAIVDFVRFRDYAVELAEGLNEGWGKWHYVAFVLEGKRESARLIDLGEADTIEKDIKRYTMELTKPQSWDVPQPKQTLTRYNAALRRTGRVVSRKVFAPIASATSAKMLCLVLDGELAELPFECLPHGKNSWIVDKYRISYVASSCDVLAKMSAARPSSPGCVVAAPDYDLGYIAPNDRVFEPLQGTLPEGEDVGKLLGVRPLTGPQATKPAVLAVSGPWVLHLATHGLFFDQRLPTPAVSVLPPGMTVTPFEEGTLFEEGSGLVLPTMSRFDWLQNYDESYGLPRSALALAGVNSWMLGGEPQDAGNGLLTQSDILGMDLVGTELVVLSACQTGRGRTVTAMEPLLGLRRAFLIAGARAVIASSWNVPDDATRYLMKMFYTRFVAGESIREALRNAQLDTKVLYGLPYYWGAFTCLGATSPWVE